MKKNIAIADALAANRNKTVLKLSETASIYPRWKNEFDQAKASGTIDVALTRFLSVFVDYLIKYFQTGDSSYLSLYGGEKLKLRYDKSIHRQELAKLFQAELVASREAICDCVSTSVGPDELAELKESLNYVESCLTAETKRTLKVLWVADCLYLDIQAFLAQQLAEMQVELDITLVTTKNPFERRSEIQRITESEKFDLVFYSPLTYEFHLDFSRFQDVRAVFSRVFDRKKAVEEALQDIDTTLKIMSAQCECDIFVHNTANVHRSEWSVKSVCKYLATYQARMVARSRANEGIAELVQTYDSVAFGRVYLIDEMPLVRKIGDWRASQYFYKAELQHPSKLGQLLADVYADIVFVHAYLKRIKLIVSDLDDTLWQGVIGEGAVTHHHDRQMLLKVLRQSGILLSINSKNDVRNVHWKDAVLEDSDFVAKQINWDSKAQNMVRIQEDLNLGLGNFLFIDDRAQEREMVRIALPDILCMDAESPETWRRLGVWSALIKSDGELDRTKMYRERAERESAVRVVVSPEELMAQLGLKVFVRKPEKRELARVTELINRTNQFNCTAGRTSFREVQNQYGSDDWKIYVAEASDRFGDMGIVCVLVARIEEDMVDIETFVLSCRVFGYGIETAVLKQLAVDHSAMSIRGRIIKTEINGPCWNVYKDNGFVSKVEDLWVLHPQTEIKLQSWLGLGSHSPNAT